MKQVLQKAYLQDRSLKHSKAQPKPQVYSTGEQLSEPLIKMQKESRQIEDPDLKPKDEIPEPLSMGYFNNIEKDDSSSE